MKESCSGPGVEGRAGGRAAKKPCNTSRDSKSSPEMEESDGGSGEGESAGKCDGGKARDLEPIIERIKASRVEEQPEPQEMGKMGRERGSDGQKPKGGRSMWFIHADMSW